MFYFFSERGPREGDALVAAQVRQQRGGEVCGERQQSGETVPDWGGLHRQLGQPHLCPPYYDEGKGIFHCLVQVTEYQRSRNICMFTSVIKDSSKSVLRIIAKESFHEKN